MKRLFLAALCIISLSCNNSSVTKPISETIQITPKPKNVKLESGVFSFDANTKIVAQTESEVLAAEILTEKFQKAATIKLEVIEQSPHSNVIQFKENTSLQAEAYHLIVSKDKVTIEYQDLRGAIYGVQTLLQLLPNAIENSSVAEQQNWSIPCVEIEDAPQFKWRGVMLDVSRHFFEKEYILKTIDRLSFLKMNTLHLHLVDDQGWRIEIKKYPKLTSVGGFRVDQEEKPWNARSKNSPEAEATYGGFYTQEDIKEMVAYAQKRGVTIVPEIEMPAHVSSAIAAYPELTCFNQKIGVPSGGVWPITDIFCPGKESTFEFLEDVLDEVLALFPSTYIHLGGDEATKTNWEKCPHCQQRIKTEGLTNVDELQSYFMSRMERYISKNNRKMIGWDEIIEGGIAPGATVMSWRGTKGGLEATVQGHDVIMTPTSHCYFDYYQGPQDVEPKAWGSYVPSSKVYQFNPIPKEMDSVQATHVLGGQANLWAEYIPTEAQSEYMFYPRLASMSEALWSTEGQKDWDDFSERLPNLFQRFEFMGINYAESVYTIQSSAKIDSVSKNIMVSLQNEIPSSDLRYVVNQDEISSASAEKYTKPIEIAETTKLKASRFVNNNPVGKVFEKEFVFHKAVGKSIRYKEKYSKSYQGVGDGTLVNVLRGSTHFHDGQWLAWLGSDMEAVIDLSESTTISKVTVGTLENQGSGIYFPTKVAVYLSEDGQSYALAKEIERPFKVNKESVLKTFECAFETKQARYVKVKVKNLAKAPNGGGSWLFVDEVVVE
ncbi:beta-N-acetylhexosaminidase [Joostella sp. CR20]|uniref:beta-N-acetylhexosaminidase n=1 Tax=Joostella sp. CR20 TaxID=2804312 RepID=UPI00313C3AB0